jgi:hypothetical protein
MMMFILMLNKASQLHNVIGTPEEKMNLVDIDVTDKGGDED